MWLSPFVYHGTYMSTIFIRQATSLKCIPPAARQKYIEEIKKQEHS